MYGQTKRFYEFESFRIDAEERQLMRDGRLISLTPKAFDLLLVLVENGRHTLTKDELIQRLWTGTFVEENNLSRNISMLRKALGDDFHDSRFIKTIPKRGYRFDSNVKVVLEEEEDLLVERRASYTIGLRGETREDGESWTLLSPTSFFSSRYRVIAAMVLAAATLAVLAGAISWTRENRALATRGTANDEAFDLYRRGRELWRNRSAAGLHEATLLLEQAVEKEPDFALGHAALADAYAFDTGNWTKTEETAKRAIEIDPNLGEPYATLGFVELFWKWNSAEAERYFKKSIALNPEYATARQWYAVRLAADRQFNEALAEINRALELEPQSVAMNADFCQILYFVQRYDDAETQCKKTIALDPNFFAAHLLLYEIYTAKGMYAEAFAEFFRTEQLAANHSTLPEQLDELKSAFERGGIREFWRTQIKILNGPSPDAGYTTAWYYAQLGNKDKALLCLERSYEKRDFGFVLFAADPVLREYSDDPRYVALHARLFNK